MRRFTHHLFACVVAVSAVCIPDVAFGDNQGGGSTCLVDPANCLQEDGPAVSPSDHDVWVRWAEDFVAQGPTIEQICVVGAYIDAAIPCETPSGPQRCDCACQDDVAEPCDPVVVDNFEICIYADSGGSPIPGESSYPGMLVVCAAVTSVRTLASASADFDKWDIALVLDEPITSLTAGEIYWLEVTNNTILPPENTCDWHWAFEASIPEGGAGNDWSVYDYDGWYQHRDGRPTDHEVCIDQGMVSPAAPTGACCLCAPLGDCVGGQTKAECDGLGGGWNVRQACETGFCRTEPPPGDDCATDAQVISNAWESFTNECSTTDGPPTVDVCVGLPPQLEMVEFGSDVWYFYTATCTGRLTVSMCEDAEFDAVVAIYSSGTSTCVCPTGLDQPELATDCGNDTCGAPAGPPEVQKWVDRGDCYTIRVAGAEGAQGVGSFSVECESLGPTPSLPPEHDYAPVPVEVGSGTKNRYLTFRGVEVGMHHGIRVTFMALPGFEYAEGRRMWVQEPFEVGEASGTPGPGAGNFWAARLGCDVFYTDWTAYDRVDVYDDSILPSAAFDVQAINDDNATHIEDAYSDPLSVVMSAAGDVVGDCAVQPCTAPQGAIDFVDISAVVDKFRNLLAAPRKARVDLVNSDLALPLPDRKVDFVDISCAVEAFRGTPCVLPGPPEVDPCAR